MSSRSMARGCVSRGLGWGALLCAYLGSNAGGSTTGLLEGKPWTWEYAIPWMIVALVLGNQARSAAKREIQGRQETENAKALEGGLPFILMLRPFSVDNRLSVKNPDKNRLFSLAPSAFYEAETIPITRLLAQAVQPGMHLRVIGGEPIGPGVVKVDDAEWQERFLSLTRDARGIIMVALPGKEIPWELHQLRLHGWLSKSVFLLPPAASAADDSWFAEQLEADGFNLPRRGNKTLVFRMSESGGAVEERAFNKLDYNNFRTILEGYKLIPLPEEGVPVVLPHRGPLAALIGGAGNPSPGLIPALAVMFLVCFVAAFYVVLQDDLGDYGRGDNIFWFSAACFFVTLLGTVLSFSLSKHGQSGIYSLPK